MSVLRLALILLLTFSATGLQAQEPQSGDSLDRPLIDPDFAVPNLDDRILLLEDRFFALAEHLEAMRQRLSRKGVDARLDELFLPEEPEAFARYYETELRIAKGAGRLADWRHLAAVYLERGQLDGAAVAGYLLYRDGEQPQLRAFGLNTMAEAVLPQHEVRQAVNLYRRSLEFHDESNARQRLQALIERHDLQLRDLVLEVESRLPRACLVFSQELAHSLPLPVGDYMEITPAADVDISVSGDRICLSGLRHGGDYQVRLRPGLLGAEGARLRGGQEQRFQVPDRAPRVRFSSNSYVLPATAAERLPVTTVNLSEVALKLYRIADRNLINPILSGQIANDLYEGTARYIEQSSGSLVWQGSLGVSGPRNEEVVTLLSMAEILPAREPGIYALFGRPLEEQQQDSWGPRATQWLVISDLGLLTFAGDDGLHVVARSLGSAVPMAGVGLTLVARNNEVLGEAVSDGDGLGRFAPGLLRGQGGDAPAFVTARTAAGDYNFLRLTGAALDLSERGIGGRMAPRGLDAFVYSERGVYRPGETVNLSVLLRDAAARAEGGRPLTLKVVRPGGTEVYHATTQGDELGGYLFEVPLSPAARPGSWTASAYLDAQGTAIGSAAFQVEDFVPPRIEAVLTSVADWLAPGVATDLHLSGKFLYGPPAADLETESRVALLIDPLPYPDYADYQFGLVQETFRPRRFDLENARSDQNGEALIRLTVDQLPDSSHPLKAEVTALLLDLGGRPVAARLALPLRSRPVEVGLRPRFKGALGRDAEAVFDLLALDPAGQPVSERRVTYEWVREIHEYSWYRQGDTWRHRITVHDEIEEVGALTLNSQGGGTVARRFETGRYRLDLFDAEGASAASVRFSSGWWYQPTTPDVPDALELSLESDNLSDGETLHAFVKAPFAGQALVTVVNDRLRARQVIDLPPDGAEFALPISTDWGPGAYLMVTAFRPAAGKPSPLPTRALGLAWFAIEQISRTLDVEISVPEVVAPRQAVTLPLRVRGADAGETLRVTLAAVDEGILQLTGFATPRPQDHFLGQRRLAMDVRDLYGRLIRPLAGQPGRLRSGGDRARENAQGTTLRTVKTVALYQRDIVPDEDGKTEVTLDLPDFNGRLRLMAVAYGKTRVGNGEAALVVRDPLIADLLLPRFLAPGDEALATLDLQNLSGMKRDLRVTLAAEGAVALADGDVREISLGDGARHTTRIAIVGKSIGAGRLMLSVTAEGLASIEREWDIAVRPAQPYITRRLVRYLQPGESATLTGAMATDLLPETASVNVTVTARPDFNLPDLLESLDRYPYGCTEQTVSRALPLLYYGDLAQTVGQDRDDQDTLRKIDRAIRRTLDRQRGDGSFAVWQSFGRAHPWLTAYVFDFLTRAKEAGRPVPPAAYGLTLTWLQRSLENRQIPLYAKAYSYYVLARIGEVKASSLRYFAESQAPQIRTRLGLGQLAAALALVGERERAEGLFEQAIAKRRPKLASIQDYGSDLRDGAAIAALLAEAGDGSTRSQRLASSLEQAFDRRAYFNTQEEAWLVLATHALSSGKGSELQIALADGSRLAQDQAYRRSFSAADLGVDFSVENQGEGPIRVITTTRAVPAMPLPSAAEGFTLTRTFFQPDGSLAAPEALRQNDRFVILLEGKAVNDRKQQALVVDLLPAGFEIENPTLGGEADKAAFSFLPQLSETAFTAARVDRFVAALDLAPGQSFAVAYLVRAVTPGHYSLPGSFVEDMYRPQYHARGALSNITIAAP